MLVAFPFFFLFLSFRALVGVPLVVLFRQSSIVMPEAVQPPPPAHLSSSDRGEERPHTRPPSLAIRGDLPFVEAVTNRPGEGTEESSSLPLHHPADRGHQSRSPTWPSTQIANETRPTNERASTTKSFFGRLKSNQVPLSSGLQRSTLLLFAILLTLLGATITFWVFAYIRMKAKLAKQDNPMRSLSVLIHVPFVVIVIALLVHLHRQICNLRKQRSDHLRPGGELPRHRRSRSSRERLTSLAPWNRPPLPTYNTVLAESGVATGDVDDNLIAIPPPPAYGNVRESTLLTSTK